MKAIQVHQFGGPDVLLNMMAHRARVVVIGSRGEVQINPRDIMTGSHSNGRSSLERLSSFHDLKDRF
jgi:hypothetical protein